jgi:3-oxoacyl-(acyl-carrier-protein) synthase
VVLNRVFVHGLGAVSPAGWGVAALAAALDKNEPLPTTPVVQPGGSPPADARLVPPAVPRPAWLAHPRLRRSSAISQYAAGAALEALGEDASKVTAGSLRLGVVVCVMSGGVAYSRRFYDEALHDPATASPLLFPETVMNAPASHVAACLNCPGINYTLVGDPGMFLQGLAVGAAWLAEGSVDGCLVVGTEEVDWPVGNALRLFLRSVIHAGGAGALYLRGEPPETGGVELQCVTRAWSFAAGSSPCQAAMRMRLELPKGQPSELLCDSTRGIHRADADELSAWRDWTGARLSPKRILGEGLAAASAWQCVAACDALKRGRHDAANVSVVGPNQQAVGARFAGI